MRILFSSDLHFGFTSRTSAIHESVRLRELGKLKFDAVFIAGDLGTARLKHLEAACRFLRRLAGDRPVVVVLGNHDFWDKSIISFEFLKMRQAEILRRFNIISLQDTIDMALNGEKARPLLFDGRVVVVGYNGWYANPYPMTNDRKHIPGFGLYDGSNLVLSKLSDQSLPLVLEMAMAAKELGHKVIVMTHFGSCQQVPSFKFEYSGNTRHFEMLDGVADLYLFGHSHHGVNTVTEKGTRLFNVGGDYDRPRYVVLEI